MKRKGFDLFVNFIPIGFRNQINHAFRFDHEFNYKRFGVSLQSMKKVICLGGPRAFVCNIALLEQQNMTFVVA